MTIVFMASRALKSEECAAAAGEKGKRRERWQILPALEGDCPSAAWSKLVGISPAACNSRRMAVESRAGKQISRVGGRPDEKHLTLPRPVCSRSLRAGRPARFQLADEDASYKLPPANVTLSRLVCDTSVRYRPNRPSPPLPRHSLVMSRYLLFTLLLLVFVGLVSSSFLEFVWAEVQ